MAPQLLHSNVAMEAQNAVEELRLLHAEQASGSLTIQTAPGKGTRISVRIPWRQHSARRRA